MSALPAQVRKQVEKADKLAKEYYASLQGEEVPATPPAETPPAPPASSPAEPPAETPPEAPPVQMTKEEWEQRYRVLQGKYNAEVPRLQASDREKTEAIRNLQQQLTATQNLLASLHARQGAVEAEPEAPPAPVKLVKDEEVREFGADLIDLMRRVVREENTSLLPEIDRRVQPVANRVNTVAQTAAEIGRRQAQNDQQGVLAMLDRDVPNWKTQNSEQGFIEWLEQIDPYAGVKRGFLLTEAYKRHDGPRVVAFFLGYQREHATVAPPAEPAAPPPAQPQKRLEQFVAPGTPKPAAGGTPDGSGKRVWTRADIGKFYSDVRTGKYTPDEAKKVEADIFAAQSQNRIR